ncbi:hypothetical protein BDB00DRAFT_853697 [Zychaea mexicana]|uniref:uncharacterized protein n=1 Tax=Zychaea mexicana TaxID=64656 RepID=UPI0022FF2E1F|nr:uncharacterized protein BDB00DRAFT_853697 [Zychaea mexicana]KAI9484771.1 hypothetical protein BDB00DRAFT_853697 [Zychaea mexicana]
MGHLAVLLLTQITTLLHCRQSHAYKKICQASVLYLRYIIKSNHDGAFLCHHLHDSQLSVLWETGEEHRVMLVHYQTGVLVV